MSFKLPICPRDINMINNPTNPCFLLFIFSRILLAMAQNSSIPINVGVVLNFDTLHAKMWFCCINMAVSDFYASHSYYTTRLVLHKRDSKGDVILAAGAAVDLIRNVEVQAIIGPESSKEANFVIYLGDKAQVPMISFSATSPSLRGSYFFRISQNDSSQVAAISTIFQAFGWSEAVPISIANEFGEGVVPYLTTALQAVGARIPYWSIIHPMATSDQIALELNKLKEMETRVFIVHMLPSLGSRLFSKAKEMGMMDEGYVWIVTNGMTNMFGSSNSSVIDNMQGVLGLKTYVPNTKELENFRVRWQRKFQQENPTILNAELDVFGMWAYDAAWALAMVVENVGSTDFSFQEMNLSRKSTYLGSLKVSRSGPKLVQELSGTRFRGISGDFSLVDGQLQSSTYQVVNINENGERGIGYWTPQDGLTKKIITKHTTTYSTSNTSLGSVIWPGDTTSTPKGWEIPINGRKLKILVPVRTIKEFMNVTDDPSTNKTVYGGFCIEVFEAINQALPYHVPYEFYPYATPDGTYDSMINQVFLRNYDAAVGDISIRANRSLFVDFTLPYIESGMSMVVPMKDNNSTRNTWMFLKPLTWDLWVISGCFFIFIGFVVWVLEHRINEDFRGPPHHQIGTSFWFSFSTMVFAHREQVVSNLARFVVIIWGFVVLILTQSYTASLTSFLTVQQLQPTITDVNVLLKNGDAVGYQKGSFVYGILKQLGFQDEKLRTYSSTQELAELFQNMNENHGISAAFDETPYMRLFLATYCSNYTMVEPIFKVDGFAFVFQKGSLLTRDFSTAITKVHEGGVMNRIEDKYFKKKATCSNPSTRSSSDSLTLSLYSFWGLFLIAGVASSLALLVFLVMFLYEHRHTLKNFDPETSFWRRIRAILRVYDQRDPSSHTYNRRRLQDSVYGIGAVEPSSRNSNSSPRPSIPNHIESHIVLEGLKLSSTDAELGDLNQNGQATQQVNAVRLTPPSEYVEANYCIALDH